MRCYLPAPLESASASVIGLALDCLRQIGPDQWALHVPLGKLHTERLVPADENIRRIVARILALRALAPPARLAKSEGLLLPRYGGHYALYQTLLWAWRMPLNEPAAPVR